MERDVWGEKMAKKEMETAVWSEREKHEVEKVISGMSWRKVREKETKRHVGDATEEDRQRDIKINALQ